MKKVVTILLGLTLVCSVLLAGCGDADDGKITEPSSSPVENSTNMMENASSRLADDMTRASGALSEAGSEARDDLTKIGEGLSNAADDAKEDISNALS
ncbi:MAG TPA: hypothetical protein IAD07_11630 [Candidatus Fimivicinus intestinavium]|nr:hypothetical protein [Candidatus Fimivicinus intestinavium]